MITNNFNYFLSPLTQFFPGGNGPKSLGTFLRGTHIYSCQRLTSTALSNAYKRLFLLSKCSDTLSLSIAFLTPLLHYMMNASPLPFLLYIITFVHVWNCLNFRGKGIQETDTCLLSFFLSLFVVARTFSSMFSLPYCYATFSFPLFIFSSNSNIIMTFGFDFASHVEQSGPTASKKSR